MSGSRRLFNDAALALAASAVLVLWGLRLAASTGQGMPPDGPSAKLTDRHRDLGTLSPGQILTVAFPVWNGGNRRLLIRRTGVCCGDDPPPPVVVPPGDTALLEVRIESDRWCGRLVETVDYATNDPRLPTFRLSVTGQVEPTS